MADSSGGTGKETPINKGSKKISRSDLPLNPVHRLFYRELGGTDRHHRHSLSNQILGKLLAFSLRSLVDENVLDEGHVFLGFSKSSQCVLSYTLNVEADDHTAYPIYVYRLQWWRFIPYKKLTKIGEVRLFGEEEIQQDLYVAVCEWPTDDSRLAVHGICYGPTGDAEKSEKRQCYVTIAATPPLQPCEDCSQLVILHMQNASLQGDSSDSSPPRCIQHGFAVHTKYELAPPYPNFAPKIFLKLDGVVVINTGDSLVALSVDIEDNHGGFGFGLYSPRVAHTMSTVSSVSSPSEDQISTDSHDPMSSDKDTATDILGSFLPSPPHSYISGYRFTPKDTTNVTSPNERDPRLLTAGHIRERRISSTGKENQLSKNIGSPLGPNTDSNRLETPSKTQRPIDVYNFEVHTPTPKKEGEADSGDFLELVSEYPHSSNSRTTIRSSLSFSQSAKMTVSAAGISYEEIALSVSQHAEDSRESQGIDSNVGSELDKVDPFEKPTALPRMSAARDPTLTPPPPRPSYSALSLVPPPANAGVDVMLSHPLTKALCSPSYPLKYDTGGSSTCSSCVSSPIILQSDSQCFTYSVRRYIDAFGMDGPIDMEDDLNLAYHSVLPLEVHGANYSHLRLLTKQCTAPQMPCVVVKQLTLDIEHYLGETVRTKAEWGHRYMSFSDYDVQILEVCPDSSEVIALVFVLIRARPPRDKAHHTPHGTRYLTKLYQSNLKLVWNLKTGSFNTLQIDDLVEVNQVALMRRRQCWQPGLSVCRMLHQKFSIPQSHHQSVHVLTNQAVIKGQSLKMIFDRHNYVAIIL